MCIDNIKILCDGKGITVSELEKELGFSNGSISKAKSMSAERLFRISRYFGVSPEYLITGRPRKKDGRHVLIKKQNELLLHMANLQISIAHAYSEICELEKKRELLMADYARLTK